MTKKEMLDFLHCWQDKLVINKFGVIAKVDGLTIGGKFVLLLCVVDTQVDNKHPSRVGATGMVQPSSLGSIWKEYKE